MEDLTPNSMTATPQMGENKREISKPKELFLDTKGACFLCLENTKISSENNISANTLMTEICLRNICRYFNINPCHILLKSLKGDILNDEEKEEARLQRNKCDFSVTLCSNCASISWKLSELACQLEMTKMLINQKVTEFHQKLTASEQKEGENEQCRWEKLKELLSSDSGSNPVESRLVENLRQEAKVKCASKVERLKTISLPKVKLDQLKTKPSDQDPELGNSENIEESISISNDFPTEVISIDDDDNDHIDKSDTNENVQQLIIEYGKKYSRILQPRNRLQCTLCNLIIVTHQHSQYTKSIQEHLVNYHPGKFFQSNNLENLSEESKNINCRKFLISEVNTIQKISVPLPRFDDDIACKICQKKLRNIFELRYHYVFEHYNFLKEKLVQFEFEEGKTPKNVLSAFQEDWICDVAEGGCGRMFPWKHNLENHKKQFCPNRISSSSIKSCQVKNTKIIAKSSLSGEQVISEILQIHCKKSGKSSFNIYSCLVCKNLSQPYHKNIMIKHLANSHPEVFFDSYFKHVDVKLTKSSFKICCKNILTDKENYQKNSSGSKKSVICAYCQAEVRGNYLYNLLSHLVMEHYDVLEEKLASKLNLELEIVTKSVVQNEELEDNVNVTANMDNYAKRKLQGYLRNKRLRQNRKLGKITEHSPKNDKIGKTNHWICEAKTGGCGKAFAWKYNLVRHKKGYCPNRKLSKPSEENCGKDPLEDSHHQDDDNIDNPPTPNIEIIDNFLPETEENNVVISNQIQYSEPNSSRFSSVDAFYSEFDKKHCQNVEMGKQCIYCKYVSKEAPCRIYMHVLSNHLERVFNSVKLEQLPDTEFLECCKQAVLLEMKKGKEEGARRELKPTLEKSKRKNLILCVLCDRKYNYLRDFRYHFVFKHYEILEKNLMRLQNLVVEKNEQRVGTHFMMMTTEDDKEEGMEEEFIFPEENVQVEMENLEEGLTGNEQIFNNLGGDDGRVWEYDVDRDIKVSEEVDLEEINVVVDSIDPDFFISRNKYH